MADLGRRQHPAVAGLGPLRQLDLDHLHLRRARVLGEACLAETAIVVAATEITRADLPDQVAAGFAVVGRDRAFAGVVVEIPALGARVERADGIGRQRAEAHRRDVEHAGRVWLRGFAADDDAEIVGFDFDRRQRMVQPFVIDAVHALLAAERDHVVDALRTLVDQSTLLARERDLGGVAFDEVLAHLRADRFQPVAEVGEDRIVAAEGAALLHDVPAAQQRQRAETGDAPPPCGRMQRQQQRQQCKGDAERIGQVTGHRVPRGVLRTAPKVGDGARSRNRTGMGLPPADFKSSHRAIGDC